MFDNKLIFNDLRDLRERNPKFAQEFKLFSDFYTRKFVQSTTNEKNGELAYQIIVEMIASQFFYGYGLMQNYINEVYKSNEQVFLDEFWETPEGLRMNTIGQIMVEYFGKEWAYSQTKGGKENLKVLNQLNEVYDLYRTILLEAANYGAHQAIIYNSRYNGGLTEDGKQINGLRLDDIYLGNPYDLNFVTPQTYMQLQFYSTEHEWWDMFTIHNGIHESEWVGTVSLSKIPTNDGTVNTTIYILSLTLGNKISPVEKMAIAQSLFNELPSNIQSLVQVRLNSASELDILNLKK